MGQRSVRSRKVGVLKQIGVDRSFELGWCCLLGRNPACDLRIDNPRVSGEHASLHWVDDRWELRDLGSRNGTFVDGRRLGAGERTVLARGATFILGREDAFRLEDASPPVASARHGASGQLRTAVEGLLVLPDEERPEVSIFEDASGRWVAEDSEGTRFVADRDIVIADGEGWILNLPNAAGETQEISTLLPAFDTITLRFAVSRHEEHVEVTVVHGCGSTAMPARAHHYLLLTLARAIVEDEDASPAERGWVDREELCRRIGTDGPRLNVDVFRNRRQFAALGIHGAAGIIERRPGTGQLRLGTARVEVTKL
jgi:pSer/pThr/pTyr-binding forkhead associated (FHA) protein